MCTLADRSVRWNYSRDYEFTHHLGVFGESNGDPLFGGGRDGHRPDLEPHPVAEVPPRDFKPAGLGGAVDETAQSDPALGVSAYIGYLG